MISSSNKDYRKQKELTTMTYIPELVNIDSKFATDMMVAFVAEVARLESRFSATNKETAYYFLRFQNFLALFGKLISLRFDETVYEHRTWRVKLDISEFLYQRWEGLGGWKISSYRSK